MKIVGRGSLDVTTVVAACCLAVIVVELASAAEQSKKLYASVGQQDHKAIPPCTDGNLNRTIKKYVITSSSKDIATSNTSSLPQGKRSADRPEAPIDQKGKHAEQSVKHSAIITTYRPKTAAIPLEATTYRQQDLQDLSTKTDVNHQGRIVKNSTIVTTFRPKVAFSIVPGKDKPKTLKEQIGGNRGTSEPTLNTPSTVAERRQDHQNENNLKPINAKSEARSETIVKTSSPLAVERKDKEEAPKDANGNHQDQIAQSSAIISAFDTVAKGWKPSSAPWRNLPQKHWLFGQQSPAASANSQYQSSASVMGHNPQQLTTPGQWAATTLQQQAVVLMRKIPVPYPVPVERQVPMRIEVPVNKPYPVYIPRPYHVYMEKKIPYRVPVPVPAPYTIEKRIPVPVRVPVQKPYPVHVPAPYPVYIMKKVPYTVAKEIQVPVGVPVEKPYIVHVPVEKRVPYPVEKEVPVPVQVPVEKPVPVQVEKKVPVYIEKRVPVYIQRLVPYPVKIPVRVPIPVPYYTQQPSRNNQQVNSLRSLPFPYQMEEPEPTQSSFHHAMVFPKKATHTHEAWKASHSIQKQNGDHYDHRINQQFETNYPASANYDENEDEENYSSRNHQVNYLRALPSSDQMEEPEGAHSSFHQVMIFPKKASHTHKQRQNDDHDDRRVNQQLETDYPPSANYDENEEEENDSSRRGFHGYDQADRSQQTLYDEHSPEENGYNYETEYEDYERERDHKQYRFHGPSYGDESYDEDEDYGEEKHQSYTKVNMGAHEFSSSVNHQR